MYAPNYKDPDDITILLPKKDVKVTDLALIAYNTQSSKVAAAGQGALDDLLVESDIDIITTLISDRQIQDFKLTEMIVKYMIHKACGIAGIRMPRKFKRVAICYQDSMEGITELTLKTYEDLGYSFARDVILVRSSIDQFFYKYAQEPVVDLYKIDLVIEIGTADNEKYIRNKVKNLIELAERMGFTKEQLVEYIGEN